MKPISSTAKRMLLLFMLVLLTVSCVTVHAADTVTITGSKYVAVNKKVTLKANQKVTWKTSNKKIATVSASGVVKGIKAGKVTITAASKAKKSIVKKWTMTVLRNPVSSISITAPSSVLEIKGQTTLKAKIKPASAAQEVTWKSSNTSVAKISSKGKVTALKAGKTTITATAVDGSGKKASVTIQVKAAKKNGIKIGISLPTDTFVRFKNDGQYMKKLLNDSGYTVVLNYADNQLYKQIAQVQNMLADGCKAIIVNPIVGDSLGEVLDQAKKAGVFIIAYDRLLVGSDAVSHYVNYDFSALGRQQGTYIKNALKLDTAKGPFNLEIMAGEPRDSNASVLFNGAMEVLKPYIKSGKLVIRSGRSTFNKAATAGWMTDAAQTNASKVISSYYPKGKRIDAWLCSNDSTAAGVIQALTANYSGKWPVITGMDCDLENVRNIIAGKQSMSLYRQTLTEAELAVEVTKTLVTGKKPSKDSTTDNGAIKVPTTSASAVVITKNNYTTLIKDGIYTKAQLS